MSVVETAAGLADASTCDAPTSLEGVVVEHCAYGTPGYGENPATDARDTPLLFVFDSPRTIAVHDHVEATCMHDVGLVQVRPANDPGGTLHEYAGKRVRFSVAGFTTPVGPHDHTRVVLWAADVNDARASDFRLRSVWERVKHDFIGVSCTGWTR